jgi:hypothetical protein
MDFLLTTFINFSVILLAFLVLNEAMKSYDDLR